MRIDGFTCCVGPVYAEYLSKSLSVWSDTLDSLTVVTNPDDPVLKVIKDSMLAVDIVETNLLTAYGAMFNKGAALCEAWNAMNAQDAVLHFDSDIVPEPGWRDKAERLFKNGCIHGAKRHDERGKIIFDAPPFPYGYFHLFHSTDTACLRWSIFEPWHPSAGGYDIEFLEHWNDKQRVELPIHLTHLGEVRRNWFGVGLPEKEQQESFRRMNDAHRRGLHRARMDTRTNRLKVPEPVLKISLQLGNLKKQLEWLKVCSSFGPFAAQADVKPFQGSDSWNGSCVELTELIKSKLADQSAT